MGEDQQRRPQGNGRGEREHKRGQGVFREAKKAQTLARQRPCQDDRGDQPQRRARDAKMKMVQQRFAQHRNVAPPQIGAAEHGQREHDDNHHNPALHRCLSFGMKSCDAHPGRARRHMNRNRVEHGDFPLPPRGGSRLCDRVRAMARKAAAALRFSNAFHPGGISAMRLAFCLATSPGTVRPDWRKRWVDCPFRQPPAALGSRAMAKPRPQNLSPNGRDARLRGRAGARRRRADANSGRGERRTGRRRPMRSACWRKGPGLCAPPAACSWWPMAPMRDCRAKSTRC